jgi:uncharacterized protein involved in exopolysaccharide biosynthesis
MRDANVSASAEAHATTAPNYIEVDLAAVWRRLWKYRWFLLVLLVAGGVIGGVTSYFLPKYYESRTTLLPMDSMSEVGRLGSIGNLGGLASLAGIKIGGSADASVESLEMLKSRHFTLDFIRDRQLRPAMFPRKWDAKSGAWKVSGEDIPTDEDAFQRFDRKVRSISQDRKTGVITLTVRWRDPVAAADLANDLVARLNRTMQARAVSESESAIRQLQTQLQQTNVVPLRGALAEALESEVKKKTLALVRDEFAMRVIDPAVATERWEHVSPSLPLFTIGGALLAVLGGACFALVLGARRDVGG